MNDLLTLLVPVLGVALLHFLWQGALIGVLTAVALMALRHASSQARYALACAAMLACLLAPVATIWLQLSLDATSATTTTALVFAQGPTLDAGLSWVVLIWVVGFDGMLLRLALGLYWIRSLRRAPACAGTEPWQQRVDVLAARFGLRRRVRLRVLDKLDSPLAAGWWQPYLYLPAAVLMRLPPASIEALLAHELAHVRRHDYAVNLLQKLIEALLFYHPVVWWLSRRIEIEREQIADQLAAEVTGSPRQLAIALAELSELPFDGVPLLAHGARGGHLKHRIQRLLRPYQAASPMRNVLLPVVSALAFVVFSANAAFHHSDAQADTSNTTRDTYVLKHDDRLAGWGPDDDMNADSPTVRGLVGDYLWVRRDGKNHVLTNPTLLARARQSWGRVDAVSAQLAALSQQIDGHNHDVETSALGVEALSTSRDPAKQSARAQQQRALREQMQAKDLRVLYTRFEQLSVAEERAAERNGQFLRGLVDEALSPAR